MKKYVGKFLGLLVAGFLVFNPVVSVQASDITQTVFLDLNAEDFGEEDYVDVISEYIGLSLGSYMYLVNNSYVGGEIDSTILLDGCINGLAYYLDNNEIILVEEDYATFMTTPENKAYFLSFPTNEERSGAYIGKVINFVLREYPSEIDNVQEIYNTILHGMMSPLDKYSEYLEPQDLDDFLNYLSPRTTGIGVVFNQTEDNSIEIMQVIIGSPAEEAGILKGDIVKKINEFDMTDKGLEEAQNVLSLISDETEINIELLRSNETINVSLKKDIIYAPTVSVYKIDDIMETNDDLYVDYRYVQMTTVSNHTAEEFKRQMDVMESEGVKGIILDLRNNPGGYLDDTIELCQMLVPKGIIMKTYSKFSGEKEYTSELEECPFDNIYVLTNNITASAAEVITSALQDSGVATIIGTNTYGKGVVQSNVNLRTGGSLKFTTEEYFRRNGETINEIGITPDIILEPFSMAEILSELQLEQTSDVLPEVKQSLSILGYNVGNDTEIFDSSLQKAIIDYQSNNDLEATGVIDENTVLRLNLDLYRHYISNDIVLQRALSEITD